MSSQRYISTSFWDDAWIQELDSDAKLLYMYLLTCPLTNIAGVYKITARRIAFDTRLAEELVVALLEDFEASGKAAHVDEYIILPNWPKHQKTSSKDTKAGIDRVLAALPESIILSLQRLNYQYDALPTPTPKAPCRPPIGPLPSARPTLDLDLDSKPIPAAVAAGTAAPVDNFSEDQEAELLAIAFEKAKAKRGVKNPAGLARSMTRDADVLEEFNRRHPKPPEPPKPEDIPPVCPDCGREARIIRGPREAPEALCVQDHRTWTWDPIDLRYIADEGDFADTG